MLTDRSGPAPRTRPLASTGLLVGALAALVTGLLSGPVTASAATAADPTDGPILTNSGTYLLDQDGTETRVRAIEDLGRGMEFSPMGDRIAGVTREGAIAIWNADGSVEEHASVPGTVEAISWAPDGDALAVLSSDDEARGSIHRVRLDGEPAAPTLLVGTSALFSVTSFSGLAWSPTADRIAFVGSELQEEGFGYAVDQQQLYTVPAAGGAPERFNTHYSPECDQPVCGHQFAWPTYSPDGSTLAALVVTDSYSVDSYSSEQYVGTVTPGAADPAKVRRTSFYRDVPSYSHLGEGPLVWSRSGEQVLLGLAATERGGSRPTLVDMRTGSLVGQWPERPDTFTALDRQPCPTGECVSWDEPSRAAVVLSARISSTAWFLSGPRPSIRGTLSTDPAQVLSGTISLLIDGRRVRSARLTAAMANTFSFRVPALGAGRHTVRLRYSGSPSALATSSRSVTVHVLRGRPDLGP